MQKYKHLFFDLDHTLWDFKTNSINTLEELFLKYHLKNSFTSFNNFYNIYEEYNNYLWKEYGKGNITKEKLNFDRFHTPFSEAGLTDESIAINFAHDYITVSPTKTALMPNTKEVLEILKNEFKLYIITNGFKDVQYTKLKNSNLDTYFTNVYISEMIGVTKPQKGFFEYAVNKSHATKKDCLVIGDNLDSDIDGAINSGLDYVFYNPEKEKHNRHLMHEIADLKELLKIINI